MNLQAAPFQGQRENTDPAGEWMGPTQQKPIKCGPRGGVRLPNNDVRKRQSTHLPVLSFPQTQLHGLSLSLSLSIRKRQSTLFKQFGNPNSIAQQKPSLSLSLSRSSDLSLSSSEILILFYFLSFSLNSISYSNHLINFQGTLLILSIFVNIAVLFLSTAFDS